MACQWNIFRASLDPIIGREQAGERPVLVVSAEPLNERYDAVMVTPLTSRKHHRPARLGEVLIPAGLGGLRRESLALCYQVRALDKSRLMQAYGEIPEGEIRQEIARTLADCFDLSLETAHPPSEEL